MEAEGVDTLNIHEDLTALQAIFNTRIVISMETLYLSCIHKQINQTSSALVNAPLQEL